jgi:hypothetical protein
VVRATPQLSLTLRRTLRHPFQTTHLSARHLPRTCSAFLCLETPSHLAYSQVDLGPWQTAVCYSLWPWWQYQMCYCPITS